MALQCVLYYLRNKTLLLWTSLYKPYYSEVHLLNQHYLHIWPAVSTNTKQDQIGRYVKMTYTNSVKKNNVGSTPSLAYWCNSPIRKNISIWYSQPPLQHLDTWTLQHLSQPCKPNIFCYIFLVRCFSKMKSRSLIILVDERVQKNLGKVLSNKKVFSPGSVNNRQI